MSRVSSLQSPRLRGPLVPVPTSDDSSPRPTPGRTLDIEAPGLTLAKTVSTTRLEGFSFLPDNDKRQEQDKPPTVVHDPRIVLPCRGLGRHTPPDLVVRSRGPVPLQTRRPRVAGVLTTPRRGWYLVTPPRGQIALGLSVN